MQSSFHTTKKKRKMVKEGERTLILSENVVLLELKVWNKEFEFGFVGFGIGKQLSRAVSEWSVG